MFDKLSLRAKFMLPISAVIIITGLVLASVNLNNMQTLIKNAEQAQLRSYMNALTNSIANESRLAEALSTLVANMPLVQEKLANNDRKALADLFFSGFNTMQKQYDVEQFQFHTLPATAYLRIHKPEKFGDDLSSFRFSVLDANKKIQAVRGLENGVAGLGIRGVVPIVTNQSKHLGSVEFGMSFGQPFFEQFKKQNGVEATLQWATPDSFKTLANTMSDGFLTNNELLVEVLGSNEPRWIQKTINGISYSIIVQSIYDYSGTPIGAIEIAMNNTQNQLLLATTRNHALLISFIILMLGLWGSWLTANYFIRRIYAVTDSVNYIAQGDLSHSIHLDGHDELAVLARATNSMRQQLRIMANTVSEHAHTVQKAAQEINIAVENQAATSSQMSSSVAEITSTMEELSASSTQIADHSKLVVDVANQAMTGSYKGSEAMQVVLVRMEDIRNDNQASLQEIMALGAKSKQISKIMALITNLADQTKLIAFNAALEASSAGEAGKRFSVVASEIRRLADSVTDSTDEIEAKINEIQDAISRLVITSEKGANGILAGTAASNNTAEHFNDIVSAANQTSTTAQQISLSTQQQKIASSQVVFALREIVGASAHTATAISKVARISNEMTHISEQLSQATQFFKLGTED
jgi:methyl-accepting chemotaxis protein